MGGVRSGKQKISQLLSHRVGYICSPLFPPWRMEGNNCGVLKLFKSIPTIWGQQVMKVGLLKKKIKKGV